ncbi:UTP--glucose-1-phosphate uridylyltransferase GalU [Vagococcus intermedius]|uniref:UTP--glucose-1-phosphate uridylyltransferase n=1 Tax=Vagococcus intermedius TaxID=2991418 RepID=A0AAF0I8M1_9ENTE|nr:UTP--glucose-1-phosphate uridylyltransferase GalU [Vagococcus intermedius]WEG74116.1 UTP--glucose-1-phosphate uridylyltransferase GalU [Vagococcus intermedius]WEG76196.1 UTP--glucose-1-phosphate uridylyltransferase GalU [Vagococcus intermedius]
MTQIVKKAIIPAAGLGTRFLPATKAMAKEMLPIVDKPTIQFIVEEARASGITDILIITGKAKRPIEDHFDANFELEANLKDKKQLELLKLVEETTDVNLYFMRQSKPKGLGHAVSLGKTFVGDDPFVVMLGDDLMIDDLPLTKQLIDNYEETKRATLAVMEVPREETSKYGIISPLSEVRDGLYEVDYFVEKPMPDNAPSNLAIIGRYLLTPAIFDILDHQAPGAGGEIQLTDAIDTLNQTEQVLAYLFAGERYDVGDKFGFMKTSITYGLRHPEVKDQLREFIIGLGKELTQEN